MVEILLYAQRNMQKRNVRKAQKKYGERKCNVRKAQKKYGERKCNVRKAQRNFHSEVGIEVKILSV